jgi:hypothetical protein
MNCIWCFGNGPSGRQVLQAAARGGEAGAATVRESIL